MTFLLHLKLVRILIFFAWFWCRQVFKCNVTSLAKFRGWVRFYGPNIHLHPQKKCIHRAYPLWTRRAIIIDLLISFKLECKAIKIRLIRFYFCSLDAPSVSSVVGDSRGNLPNDFRSHDSNVNTSQHHLDAGGVSSVYKINHVFPNSRPKRGHQ